MMPKTIETSLSEKTFLRRLEEQCPYCGRYMDADAFFLKREAHRFRIGYRLAHLSRGERQPTLFLYGEYHLNENGCVVVTYRLAYSLGRRIFAGALFLATLTVLVSLFLDKGAAQKGMLTELLITGLLLGVAVVGLLTSRRRIGNRLQQHLQEICLWEPKSRE